MASTDKIPVVSSSGVQTWKTVQELAGEISGMVADQNAYEGVGVSALPADSEASLSDKVVTSEGKLLSLSQMAAVLGGGGGTTGTESVNWGSIADIPETFPPAEHTHAIEDVEGLRLELDALAAGGTSGTPGVIVVDSLSSTSATDALSANQGRELKVLVDGKSDAGHNHNTAYDEAGAAAAVQANLAAHAGANNPHNVTAASIGLGNVTNTADADKPVSTAMQTALDTKVNNTSIGAANGVASLDAGGKVPLSQMNSSITGAAVAIYSTYADMTAETPDNVMLAIVRDASGDTTVEAGAALYGWDPEALAWNKLAEFESMDVVLDWTNINNKPDLYTQAQTDTLLGNKVDKVSGKGLSTNDFTTALLEKLNAAAAASDLAAHTGNTNNPHGVTRAQIGAASTVVASTAAAGLCPQLTGVAGQYLNGVGEFAAPSLVGGYYAGTRVGVGTSEKFLVADTASGPGYLKIKAGSSFYPEFSGSVVAVNYTTDESFTAASKLDSGSIAPGKDYYVYLCWTGSAAVIVVSLNATYPIGYTAANSYRIGGFHTLCAAAGTITPIRSHRSAHPLSGYAAGAILPQSVWTLGHRASCGDNSGMVYLPTSDCWVDIYNLSGSITTSLTGACTYSVASAYGGTRLHTKDHPAFEAALLSVGKTLLSEAEFVEAADGGNEGTAVNGAAQPSQDTTGGRADTASRRMLSWCGVEEACGLQLQFLRHLGTGSAYDGHTAISLGYHYGNVYTISAGGHWGHGTYAGSRYVYAYYGRQNSNASSGARGRSASRHGFAG